MQKFTVLVPVNAYRSYTVVAENKNEAIEMVSMGEINCEDIIDEHLDCDTNNWIVE